MEDRLNSMTGFASLAGGEEMHSWTIEIRSVNGRGLDLRLRVPDWVDGLEGECRKRLQAVLKRGSVTLSIRVQKEESAASFQLNEDALDQSLTLLKQIADAASAAGLVVSSATPAEIAAMRGVVEAAEEKTTETDALCAAITKDFAQCLEAFLADRRREGAALSGIIGSQVDAMADLTGQAKAAAAGRENHQRQALERSLAKILEVTEIPDEERLVQEMAMIAVKSDVTEEIDRLQTHIQAARELIESADPVGRKFDFLMQEFNREANTLCSKSQSSELTAIGLELKTTIDQLREQVQNVE